MQRPGALTRRLQVYPCKGGYGRAPKSKCVGAQNAPNCAETDECEIFTVTHDGKTDAPVRAAF